MTNQKPTQTMEEWGEEFDERFDTFRVGVMYTRIFDDKEHEKYHDKERSSFTQDDIKSFISQQKSLSYSQGKERAMRTKYVENKIKEAYAQGRKDMAGEMREIVRKERLTWARESIGAKAVESVALALQEAEGKE